LYNRELQRVGDARNQNLETGIWNPESENAESKEDSRL
jgi:hypothetical protein